MPDPAPVPRLFPEPGEDRHVNTDHCLGQPGWNAIKAWTGVGGAVWEDRARVDTSVSWGRACLVVLGGLSVSLYAEWDNATYLTEVLQRLNYGLHAKFSEHHWHIEKPSVNISGPHPQEVDGLFAKTSSPSGPVAQPLHGTFRVAPGSFLLPPAALVLTSGDGGGGHGSGRLLWGARSVGSHRPTQGPACSLLAPWRHPPWQLLSLLVCKGTHAVFIHPTHV